MMKALLFLQGVPFGPICLTSPPFVFFFQKMSQSHITKECCLCKKETRGSTPCLKTILVPILNPVASHRRFGVAEIAFVSVMVGTRYISF